MNNYDNSNYYSTHRGLEVGSFVIMTLFLLAIFAISLFANTLAERKDTSIPSEVAERVFPAVEIEAHAVYVYDIRMEKVLYAKNENVRLPLASLTKVMSALVAAELSPDYGVIKITNEALRAQGDSGLYPDEEWSLGNLLDFSLITSSNDGMRAVALALGALEKSDATTEEMLGDFVRKMNLKASELGLNNTYFWNETGLDLNMMEGIMTSPNAGSGPAGGAYGTAKDVGMLMEYIMYHKPTLFEATQSSTSQVASADRLHTAKNTNNIVSNIPGLLASKTGFTDIAGGNLVIVFDPELGRPIVISILGSSVDGRFADVRKLVNATMEYINQD